MHNIYIEIKKLIENYETYRSEEITVKNQKIKTLYENIINELRECVASYANVFIHPASGIGNLTKNPIIYFLDRRETKKATEGIYVALVMNSNPKSDGFGDFKLCLTQGASKRREKVDAATVDDELHSEAINIASEFNFFNEFGVNVVSESNKLSTNIAIAEKKYNIKSVFDDDDFLKYLSTFLEMYRKYVVESSKKDTEEQRKSRLSGAPKIPATKSVSVKYFIRNPDVVASVLYRAKGVCEGCHKPAPFISKKRNEPYLEVHHKIRLADGGEDTVQNALALCPNCHRKSHYG